MNGLILLLYCLDFLGALLCGANISPGGNSNNWEIPNGTSSVQDLSTFPAIQTTSLTDPANTSRGMSETSRSMSTQSSTVITVSRASDSPTASPSPVLQTTTTPKGIFFRKECLQVFVVAGGLIIACTILLVSTLLLAWQVCQLSRHVKALSSNADLISTTEYWVGTAKKNKSNSETEAKETSMLMAGVGQTQEEMGHGTTNEAGGKINEDGQMEEENKEDEGGTVNSEEAPTTPVALSDSSSSSKPQDEATDSLSTKAVAASCSEGVEEPKDVV